MSAIFRFTVSDWAAFEETQTRKHELRNGVFVKMPDVPYEHNALTADFFVTLFPSLRKTNCDALMSSQRVYIDETDGL